MYRMLSVFLSLNFLVVLASDNNLKVKQYQSEIKLSKNERVVSLKSENENALLERTTSRELKSNIQKKTKGSIFDGVPQESLDAKNQAANASQQNQSNEIKPEKVSALSPAPTLIGKRPSIADNRLSRNSREHENLFISEVAEGSSNNKYIEIYNGTGEDVDLSGFSLSSCSNGCDAADQFDYPDNVVFADGTILADGDVFVVCHGSASDGIAAECDQTFTYLSNGDDFFALTEAGATADTYVVVDKIGDFGDDPGSGWAVAGVSNGTKDYTLVRKSSVNSGNTDWAASAGTSADDSEWIVADRPTADYTPTTLGSHEMDGGPYLAEGFEDGLVPPLGWQIASFDEYGYSSTLGWEIGPGTAWYDVSTANSGDYCAFFDVYNLWYDHESTLISPAMDFSGANAPLLKFAFADGSGSDYVEVLVSTDAGVSFTSVFNTPTSTLGWETFEVNLGAYVGEQTHVAFKMVSDYGSSNPAIDDIIVEEGPTFPIAQLSTTELDFGEIAIAASKTLPFGVENSGGGPLTWSAVSSSADFTIDVSSGTLAAGETGVISVTYTAADADGLDMGYIVITHDAESSPDSVMVMGAGHNDLYRTGFEDAWAGDPASPPDWSQITVNGVSPWYQYLSSFQSYNGDACAAIVYSSQHSSTNIGEHLLVSPAFDISGGAGYNLTFYLVGSSFYQTDLKVQISSQNADASSANWTDLATYIYNDNMPTTWTEQIIDLSAYNDGTYYIGFRSLDQNGNYVRIDDLAIEPRPATPTLGDLVGGLVYPATVVGEARTQTITITNSGLGELSGDITYPAGFTGPATFTTTTSVDVVISYSPTTSGIHSGSVLFTSNGGDGSVPVSGNAGGSVATWDDDIDGDGEGDWPAGWEVANVNGGNEWEFGGSEANAHTGDGYAYKYYEGGSDDWLISPMLDVAAGDVFSFYARSYSSSWAESMNIMLSTTGGGDPSSFDVTLGTDPAVPLEYTAYEYDLSAYEGTQIRVAIQCTSDDMFYLFVDDIATSAAYQTTGPLLYDYYSSVSFGTVVSGESGSFIWDYFNTGGSDLEVSAVSFSDGVFSSQTTFPVTTTPGGIGSFDILFSPPAGVDATYEATMTVTHNSGDDIVVTLSGYGIDAVYMEDFSSGVDDWEFIDGAGDRVWEISGTNPHLYHTYGPSTGPSEQDTAITRALDLPAVEGYHYELEFNEYMQYGGDATYCGISASTDGGVTWTEVYEANYGVSGWNPGMLDLTGYNGTVHLAFVYIGTYGNVWGIDDLVIKSKEDPIIPILATSSLGFPATAMDAESVRWLYYMNVGAGVYEGTITYPAGLTGETSITGLAVGVMDSIAVTFAPTTQGVLSGAIVFDGSASNAAEVSLYPEGNAGVEAATFEDSWIGWLDYSLAGQPYNGTPDSWLYFVGDGHNSSYYAGVYSYEPYWGGVNDFLVSPKLEVETGDVFSFWAQGGYFDGVTTPNDSVVVWISSEKPEMGEDEDGIDTGFVNTDAFTMLGEGTPPFDTWGAYSYDLSNHAGDAWLLIQSVKAGWVLKIDDVAYPAVYKNPEPVLSSVKEYDFGVTQPTGDSSLFIIRNTGLADLVIDSMDFENGEFFSVDPYFNFPLTLQTDESDTFEVYWEPFGYGVEMDTLVYHSNYVVGNEDALGNGTDHTVFIGEAFNVPPNPVALIGPSDETVLTIDGDNADGQTGIFWTNATDPDGTPVQYILEIIVENTADTLDTALTSSNIFFDHQDFLEYMVDSEVTHMDITWNVYTFDGFDGVGSSNGPWSLMIDGGWALDVDNNTLPEVFALHNNYPNPFNPTTNIGYDIPELSKVTIDIYNIAGNKVKTLVSREHQPGRYKVQWNATNEFGSPVATGMYIYKIRANGFVSVKKLLLMK